MTNLETHEYDMFQLYINGPPNAQLLTRQNCELNDEQ